ncbi:APC family permease [Aurantiacibacter luteus]|uniref:Amino acid permease n=1 Tax=Aurantiacibacter luteus TaxID=1581420 RepID=A0A0G9MSX4_9SPHN|nr:amino acid permease [Aurantiacibacter luteus]KLE33815.1 hypothetical protein AAW00_12105 [Aurantiacibacter luteus]
MDNETTTIGENVRSRGHLLRVLGVVFGLAAVVGSVIGQGILRSPGVVAEATGSETLIVALWIAGALLNCLLALGFAELGAAIPQAGGPFAFARRAFGPKTALLVACIMFVALYSSLAYLAFVVGEFLVRLGVGGGAIEPQWFGIAALALFALVNALGTRISGASQVLLSTVKGLVLIGLVIVLFASPGATVEAGGEVLRGGWLPIGTALLVILTTYDGWWNVVMYGEEVKDPGRTIPRALFGGILGVAVIYVLVNLAMLHVLTPEQMAGSTLVAADAAGAMFGEQADFALTCFGVLSVGAITNLMVMNYTRFTYAFARAGLLPAALATVSRNGTPIRAMLLPVIAASVFILTGSYSELVSLAQTVWLVVFILVNAAVIALRRREPDLPRPFRVPLYPVSIWAAQLVLVALLVIFIAQDPWYSLAGFVLSAALWAGYLLLARASGEPHFGAIDAEDLQ